MKINLHSITSLITNSSTTIYTYSDDCVKPFKELINEILKLMGETKKCNDIFKVSVVSEYEMEYDYIMDNASDEDLEASGLPLDYSTENVKLIQEFMNSIESGDIKKPAWYAKLEKQYAKDNDHGSTSLNIEVKDPKYKKLADKALKFLNSIRAEEACDY